jgi:hypothetical protein
MPDYLSEVLNGRNVEIHTRASQYDTHRHNLDHIDNVILHVVAINDRKVFNSGEEVPTATLGLIPDCTRISGPGK